MFRMDMGLLYKEYVMAALLQLLYVKSVSFGLSRNIHRTSYDHNSLCQPSGTFHGFGAQNPRLRTYGSKPTVSILLSIVVRLMVSRNHKCHGGKVYNHTASDDICNACNSNNDHMGISKNHAPKVGCTYMYVHTQTNLYT